MTVRNFLQNILLNTKLDNEIDFFVVDGLDWWYELEIVDIGNNADIDDPENARRSGITFRARKL